MNDLSILFSMEDKSARWAAEMENATARYELAKFDEHCAYLISQHEPIASLGLDREKLRVIFKYLKHRNLNRLNRDISETIALGGLINNDTEIRCPKCGENEPVLCCENCGHTWPRTEEIKDAETETNRS